MASKELRASFINEEVKCSECEATDIATTAIVSVDQIAAIIDFPPHRWRGPRGLRLALPMLPIYTCGSCCDRTHNA